MDFSIYGVCISDRGKLMVLCEIHFKYGKFIYFRCGTETLEHRGVWWINFFSYFGYVAKIINTNLSHELGLVCPFQFFCSFASSQYYEF